MEKILSLATNRVYDIEVKRNSENQMPCPECSQERKKKTAKSFSYNAEKEVGHCFNCDARFVKYEPFEKKEYVKPKWENYTKLSENAVKWFERRCISQKTLLAAKISEKKEWMPQTGKEMNCICFPYYRNDEIVNVKFRDGKKNFKLISGAELIWWNYDAINTYEEVIIVEGEMDALSVMQSGFENVISVPNGAATGKMEYFDSSFDDLGKVKSFIIATDNDLKGIELKNDLIRRLCVERCKTTSLKQYKDFNDMLVGEGVESIKNAIKNAEFIKVDDVFEVMDFKTEIDTYFENGLPQGKELGIPELDKIIRWMTGHIAIVTGAPTSGKSEFIDFVCAKLNTLYGWKTAYYSPENSGIAVHYARIFAKYIGKKFKKSLITEAEKDTGEEFLKENVFWVQPDYDINPAKILSKFEYLVKANGVKVFVIDPFNRIEQTAEYGNQIQFIQKTLGKFISFAKKTDSLLILIAHPTKLKKMDNGKFPMPSLYDVSGSADFFNMTSYGISVRREQKDDLSFENFGQVAVTKAKINETMGDTGIWDFRYNINNGRYIHDAKDNTNDFDNSNWITKEDYAEPEATQEKPLPKLNPAEAWEDEFDY